MKRILFSFLFFFSVILHAETITGVPFTPEEENMTLLLVNHADYQTLYDVLRNSTKVKNILWYRYDHADEGGFTSIKQLVDLAIDYRYLNDLKLYSLKWTSDIITNSKLGLTYPQTNFLYGLAGLLLGFVVVLGFMFAFIK